MGCNISTQPKVSPRLPAFKPAKDNTASAKNTPESSQCDPLSRKSSLAMSGGFLLRDGPEPVNSGLVNRDLRRYDEKPSPAENPEPEPVNLRVFLNEDNQRDDDKNETIAVYIRSPKRDFTFSQQMQAANASQDQTVTSNRPVGRYRKTSELFGGKLSPSNNLLLTVATNTAQNSKVEPEKEKVEEEIISKKSVMKGPPAEMKSYVNSAFSAEHELLPDTPGFKPVTSFRGSSDESSQTTGTLSKSKLSQHYLLDGNNTRITPRKFKRLSEDLGKVQRKEEPEQELKPSKSLRAVFQNAPQEQQDELKGNMTPSHKDSKDDGRDRRISETSSRHEIENEDEAEKKEEQQQQQRSEQNGQVRTMKKGKTQLKKMFTQNLLDLVVTKKDSVTSPMNANANPNPSLNPTPVIEAVQKPEEEVNVPGLEIANRQSTEYEDASLWLILNTQFNGAVRKTSDDLKDRLENKAAPVPATAAAENNDKTYHMRKNRMGPLKLAQLEFFNNGEMISPINKLTGNKNLGSATPPFSNMSFTRNEFYGSEFMDEKTITNADNISRGDFEKYSFTAEVKEIEWEEQPSINLGYKAYQNTKKSLFNGQRAKTGDSGSNINEDDATPQNRFQKNPSIQLDFSPKKKTVHKTSNDFQEDSFHSPVHTGEKTPPFIGNLSLIAEERRKPKSFQVVETNSLDKSVDGNGCKVVNQYTLFHVLGRGSFAKVKLAVELKDGVRREYAVKIASRKKLKKKLFAQQKNAFTQFQAEIAIMKKLYHPNIIQLFEVIDAPEEDKVYLVMEYAAKGAVMSKRYWDSELDESISPQNETSPFRKIRCLSEEKAKKYFRDLVRGMNYMHHNLNTVHRDIKPENLLINQNDVLKIADFNVSQMFESNSDMLQDNLGTKMFLAPEAWGNMSFRGKPADVWAAGATLYYFLYGRPPFQEKFGQDMKEIISKSEPQFPEDKGVNSLAIDLIKACLRKDPEKRIKTEEIMDHPWVTDNGSRPISYQEIDSISVSPEEMKLALTIKLQTAVMISNRLLGSLNSVRVNLLRKQSSKNE